MKPTKCKVFCYDCNRTKMLFETEKKAETFIKFNNNNDEFEKGYTPSRSYFCISCGGYHVTSKPQNDNIKSKTELVLEKYVVVKKQKEEKDKVNKERMEQRKLESKKRKKERNDKIIKEYNDKFKVKV